MSLTTKPDNVRKLRDMLAANTPENPPEIGFDMRSWHEKNECGTVCCIGGLACVSAIMEGQTPDIPEAPHSWPVAQLYLGVTEEVASSLFYPPHHPRIGTDHTGRQAFWKSITAEEASGALEVLLVADNHHAIGAYWRGLAR